MKRFLTFIAVVLLFPWGTFASEGEGESASKKPLPPPATPAPSNINTYLHLIVNNLTKAVPPVVEDRKLIMTWKGDVQPRYVAAAFLHESWREKHVFWRNQNGVYFLVLDLPFDAPPNLDYRLIVDGLWQGDPMNANRYTNDQGITMNRVSLTAKDLPFHDGPIQGYAGSVEFSYRGKPGQQVSIIGNFNQWDPFSHFLEESSPGQYRLSLTLPVGLILYEYVIGTKTFLDPGNAKTGHDAQGGVFSFFENRLKYPATVLEAALPVSHD